jgi:hypothetical protein
MHRRRLRRRRPPAAPPVVAGPIDVEATLTRAQTLLKLGDVLGAEAELRRILAASPNHIGALTTLRRVLITAQRGPELPDVLATLSAAHADAFQRDLADARLDELITLAPSHQRRAALEQKLGRVDGQATASGGALDRLRGIIGIVAILGIAVPHEQRSEEDQAPPDRLGPRTPGRVRDDHLVDPAGALALRSRPRGRGHAADLHPTTGRASSSGISTTASLLQAVKDRSLWSMRAAAIFQT